MTRTRFSQRNARLHLEHLEDRSVPSTFTVNTTLDEVTAGDGKLSLREAITKANTTPGTDTILLPAGIFKITQAGAGENANLTGDFDVTDGVIIRGAGAGVTIIDAQRKDRLFDLLGSVSVKFADLTLRHGAGANNGGAVQALGADVKLFRCVVSDNQGLKGGGINAESGNVTVVDSVIARNVVDGTGGGLNLGTGALTLSGSTVRRNLAGSEGGGIRAATASLTNSTVSGNSASGNAVSTGDGGGIRAVTASLTNCTVSGNTAGNFGGGAGGGIDANTANLTNCTVSGNSANGGGGGAVCGRATLTNCTVSGNMAALSGGGLFVDMPTLTSSTVSGNHSNADGGGIFSVAAASLRNCTVSGNTASFRGGGINATSATLTNSTVSGNTAVIEGGGLFATTATLLNCTVVENTANTGGGLFHVAGGTFSVRNTLVALNLVAFGGNGPDAFGASFISLGHNLIGDGTGSVGFTNGVNGDIVGTSANPIDPKLGPLQNNGGPTKTMALLAGSPAIDHGDNTGMPPTDERGAGFARKKDGNGDGIANVDIGAFER